jgi:hypothetical protein
MDDEARNRLIAEAQLQHARQQIQRARANLPLGIVLVVMGIAIASVAALLPLGLLGTVMITGLGFVLIPGGFAVIVRAAAAIARGNRQIRAAAPPAARVITDRRGS